MAYLGLCQASTQKWEWTCPNKGSLNVSYRLTDVNQFSLQTPSATISWQQLCIQSGKFDMETNPRLCWHFGSFCFSFDFGDICNLRSPHANTWNCFYSTHIGCSFYRESIKLIRENNEKERQTHFVHSSQKEGLGCTKSLEQKGS